MQNINETIAEPMLNKTSCNLSQLASNFDDNGEHSITNFINSYEITQHALTSHNNTTSKLKITSFKHLQHTNESKKRISLNSKKELNFDLRALKIMKHAAKLGDTHACLLLGKWHLQKSNSKEDIAAARNYFQDSADNGSLEAHFQLGLLHIQCHDNSKDIEAALTRFMYAAELGHVFASYVLTLMFYLGIDVNRDLHEALYWILNLAEKGNIDSIFMAGSIYDELGDCDNAIQWYHQAAQQGHSPSQFNLASLFAATATDDARKKAQHWYLSCISSTNNKQIRETAQCALQALDHTFNIPHICSYK